MQLEYHGAAKDSQIWVVGACGFDSIPADMGTVFLEDSFEGQVNSVETFLNIHSEVGFHGHFATWQSAIYGFACAKELGPLRRKLFPQRLPQMKPKMASRALHKNNVVGTWCLPFPGSDRSVVMRSQRHFFDTEKKRPIQMTAYVQCSSLFGAILMVRQSETLSSFIYALIIVVRNWKCRILSSNSHDTNNSFVHLYLKLNQALK